MTWKKENNNQDLRKACNGYMMWWNNRIKGRKWREERELINTVYNPKAESGRIAYRSEMCLRHLNNGKTVVLKHTSGWYIFKHFIWYHFYADFKAVTGVLESHSAGSCCEVISPLLENCNRMIVFTINEQMEKTFLRLVWDFEKSIAKMVLCYEIWA